MTTHSLPVRFRRAGSILVATLVVGSMLLDSAPARAAEPDPVADGRVDFTQTPVPASETPDELLVRYRPGTSEAERAAIEASAGLTRTMSVASDDVVTVAAETGRRPSSEVRRALLDDPAVVAVAPNYRRALAVDITTEPFFDEQWGFHNTGQAIEGRAGVSGVDIDGYQALRHGIGSSSLVVAVIDDGIDFGHPDLAARAWTNPGEAGAKATNGVDDDGNGYVDDVHGWDFCNDDNTVHDAGMDGHGTHVAGTIAASFNGIGVVGVAPGVKLMALKFIDDGNRCGLDSQAIAAIDYAASFGIRIMNASWGGPGDSAVLDAAIADSDSLFVTAAGNQGQDQDDPDVDPSYPGASTLPNILNVAAIDPSGRIAEYSNYGRTSVDIAAPGSSIVSTYVSIGTCSSACYAWADGTSMAAPHVTGTAALVGSVLPSLLADPVKLRSRILARGRSIAGAAGTTATGRLLNVDRAVDVTKPVAFAPTRFTFTTGKSITTSIPTTVGWPAGTDVGAGIATYGLKRSTSGGTVNVASGVTTTSSPTALASDTDTRFLVTATDHAGNASAAATSVRVRATLEQDGGAQVTYGSGWSTVSSGSASGGTVHRTSTAGATATFGFTGRAAAIIAPRGSALGSFKVYVDGALKTTVSLANASTTSRVNVYSMSWSSNGAHTVKVVVVGTTGHPRVEIDAFAVLKQVP